MKHRGNRGKDRISIISEEAAEWFIRCCDEPAMMLADRRELVAWMRRSPENIAELLRIAKLEGKVGQQKLILSAAGLEESNVIELALITGGAQYEQPRIADKMVESTDQGHHEPMNKRETSFWKIAAVVAALTIASLLGFVEKDHWFGENTVVTQASQWQHMTLEDGSVVHVGARTKLRVDFSKERRVVHLHRGEAVFEVAKDPERPFTVSTHLVDATAVGTRYGVSIDSGVKTTVSEGIVRVTAHGKLDDEGVELRAGQELQVPDGGLTSLELDKKLAVVPVDAQRKLEWTNGWLVFDGETIGEAVHEFNRRNVVQIRIDQPAIAARRLGSYRIRVDAPEAFVKLISDETGMKMRRDRSSNVLRLQRE